MDIFLKGEKCEKRNFILLFFKILFWVWIDRVIDLQFLQFFFIYFFYGLGFLVFYLFVLKLVLLKLFWVFKLYLSDGFKEKIIF